ncbi:MAG: T9SS type A sorting domain-containing protein [Saprospiraceae bacterium]
MMKNFTLPLLLLLSYFGYAQINLPIDFESTTVTYSFTDFSGGEMSVQDNPDMSGINTTAKVGRMIKNAGDPWGGSLMELEAPIDFSTNKHFKMKVWTPGAGRKVLLKVENLTNGAIALEKEATTTVGNAWEELVYDFTAINTAESYQKLVFIFDLGTVGDGSGNFTFYVDDIEQFDGGTGKAQVDLPITFQDTATVDYALTDFGGNASAIVVDPTDATNLVGQAIKTATAELWAGTSNGGNGLATPIPFTSLDTKMSVRVWSPDAGTPIRLKVENAANGAISVETEAVTTMAGAWETLEFNFSNEAPGTAALNVANVYNKVSIFFNFGTTGADAGEKTYYWDDVKFVGGGGSNLAQVDLPITFEDTATVNYDLTDFGGNASSIVVDPTDATNTVGKAIKTAGAELWAGTTNGGNGLATPIPFTDTDTKMSVRVWSPDANTPIRLKVENAADPTISVETEAVITMAGAWETLEFDFSNEASGTAALNVANIYNKVSIFFNFGTDGATAGEKTYYWDDVKFTGGGGSNLAKVDLPITFEDTATVDYALADFGGNASSIVVDPTDATNTVGKAIKTAGAELWAGTTNGGNGLANPVPFTTSETKMTVRVWSPDANTPIRLKVENAADGTISVETETNTTMAGAWETLEFDFSNEAPGTAALNVANTYNKVSIFFNFGTTGADAGEKTYYWDDVQFGGLVGVETLAAADAGINIYPNPFNDLFTIEFPEMLNEPVLVSLFDANGRLINETKVASQTSTIHVGDLSEGIYFLRIQNGMNSYFHRLVRTK